MLGCDIPATRGLGRRYQQAWCHDPQAVWLFVVEVTKLTCEAFVIVRHAGQAICPCYRSLPPYSDPPGRAGVPGTGFGWTGV